MYARNIIRVVNSFVCHGVSVMLMLLLLLYLISSLFMHAQKLNNDDNKKNQHVVQFLPVSAFLCSTITTVIKYC